MESNPHILIKKWNELSQEELNQMNESHMREWKTSSMTQAHHDRNIFFLLKNEGDKILAQGQLVPIDGINFNGEIFNILGIGGIIADIKKQGHGKKVMLAIKDYLIKQNKSGVGFIGLPDFYRKCGFSVNKEAIKRFAYIAGNQKIVNTESDYICYLDANDRFMEKVIQNPEEFVYLPRNPDW